MSIESFSPLPLNVFSTWVTLLDPSDVPIGMSPNLADVDFFPGGVCTRSGLVPQFPVIGGAPLVNGLKSYITTNLTPVLLVFDSLGNLYKEVSPGVLSIAIVGAAKPNLLFASHPAILGRDANSINMDSPDAYCGMRLGALGGGDNRRIRPRVGERRARTPPHSLP